MYQLPTSNITVSYKYVLLKKAEKNYNELKNMNNKAKIEKIDSKYKILGGSGSKQK